MNHVALYHHARQLTVGLMDGLSADQLADSCIHCPLWSIQDVVAHHIHYAGEVVNSTVPSYMQDALRGTSEDRGDAAAQRRDAWTQAGVDARRGWSISDLLDEWQQVTRRLDNDTAVAAIDLAVHYDDIRETLGVGSDDSDLTIASIDSYYPFQQQRLTFTGHGANLSPTDHPARFSIATNPVTVSGPAYELLRAMIGRRRRELADTSLDWGGADEATRQHFSVYGWPTD